MESVFLQLGCTGSGQNNVGLKPQSKYPNDEALLINLNCGMLSGFTLIKCTSVNIMKSICMQQMDSNLAQFNYSLW